ncbi:hypothetical protein IFM89_009395 [Coptis chinensis]|uniref:Uncharacterized protein n=1 Tax=Coptis chinensis TaxID=261450 RepID=A0A835GVM9_9MAGN|nr:hypothetical protein IFM89_009395 [Coptis chinensis]
MLTNTATATGNIGARNNKEWVRRNNRSNNNNSTSTANVVSGVNAQARATNVIPVPAAILRETQGINRITSVPTPISVDPVLCVDLNAQLGNFEPQRLSDIVELEAFSEAQNAHTAEESNQYTTEKEVFHEMNVDDQLRRDDEIDNTENDEVFTDLILKVQASTSKTNGKQQQSSKKPPPNGKKGQQKQSQSKNGNASPQSSNISSDSTNKHTQSQGHRTRSSSRDPTKKRGPNPLTK